MPKFRYEDEEFKFNPSEEAAITSSVRIAIGLIENGNPLQLSNADALLLVLKSALYKLTWGKEGERSAIDTSSVMPAIQEAVDRSKDKN